MNPVEPARMIFIIVFCSFLSIVFNNNNLVGEKEEKKEESIVVGVVGVVMRIMVELNPKYIHGVPGVTQ